MGIISAYREVGNCQGGPRCAARLTCSSRANSARLELAIALADAPPLCAFTAYELLQQKGDTAVGGLGFVVLG